MPTQTLTHPIWPLDVKSNVFIWIIQNVPIEEIFLLRSLYQSLTSLIALWKYIFFTQNWSNALFGTNNRINTLVLILFARIFSLFISFSLKLNSIYIANQFMKANPFSENNGIKIGWKKLKCNYYWRRTQVMVIHHSSSMERREFRKNCHFFS